MSLRPHRSGTTRLTGSQGFINLHPTLLLNVSLATKLLFHFAWWSTLSTVKYRFYLPHLPANGYSIQFLLRASLVSDLVFVTGNIPALWGGPTDGVVLWLPTALIHELMIDLLFTLISFSGAYECMTVLNSHGTLLCTEMPSSAISPVQCLTCLHTYQLLL